MASRHLLEQKEGYSGIQSLKGKMEVLAVVSLEGQVQHRRALYWGWVRPTSLRPEHRSVGYSSHKRAYLRIRAHKGMLKMLIVISNHSNHYLAHRKHLLRRLYSEVLPTPSRLQRLAAFLVPLLDNLHQVDCLASHPSNLKEDFLVSRNNLKRVEEVFLADQPHRQHPLEAEVSLAQNQAMLSNSNFS